MYDTIIIGRGPAGLSAAIYLSRANKKVLVIGEENRIWNKNVVVNNYFGVKETTGDELMSIGEKQAKGFGAEINNSLVVKVEVLKDSFKVLTNTDNYEANNLLIATGAPMKKKEISNEEDYVGKGVSYCVSCDGFFFKDKKVFVIGAGDYAKHEAIELLNYTKNVTLVTNGKKPVFDTKELESKGVKVEEFSIESVKGEKTIESVITNKGEFKVDGLFIMGEQADSNDFARMMGLIIESDRVKVDENGKTNLPFVWAAGDCTKGLQQVATAVGEGATSATNIIREGRR